MDFSRPIKWPNDGVHPRDEGYTVIANTIFNRIVSDNVIEF